MACRVELTPRAERDLDKLYAWLTRNAPYHGPVWFDKLEQAIFSLANFPERCTVVPRLSTENRSVRQLLFGRARNIYKVYFGVFGDVVKVLHIRHAARREPERL